MSVCVCVCVCVSELEREREIDSLIDCSLHLASWMVQAAYAIKTEEKQKYFFGGRGGGSCVSSITRQREFLAEFDLNCSDLWKQEVSSSLEFSVQGIT